MSRRNLKVLGEWGPNGTRVVASEAMWAQPIKWDQQAKGDGVRRSVFCASFADVFEGDDTMPPESVLLVHTAFQRLCKLIEQTRNLIWLLLTKRPENVLTKIEQATGRHAKAWFADCSHVWIGASIEDQPNVNRRLSYLLRIPAAVRFVSAEPMLEDLGEIDLTGINWVICGGESGPHARPFNIAWARLLRDQCRAAGVKFFMKQFGSKPYRRVQHLWHDCDDQSHNFAHDEQIHLRDRAGADPSEWPEDLRVREFPEARGA